MLASQLVVAVVAFAGGAVIGTAVGIFSGLWGRSQDTKADEHDAAAAKRLVGDELWRVAAFVERCLAADVLPSRCVEAGRASDVAPPLRAWHEYGPLLAGRLDDERWQVVTRAMDEWPVVFDAMCQAPDPDSWRGDLRAAIAAFHRHARAAAEAVTGAHPT